MVDSSIMRLDRAEGQGVNSKHRLPFAALPHALRKDPRLRGKDKAILLAAALCEYARGHKSSCYPTNAQLAADMGCSESTVRAALATLRDAGWVRVAIGPRQPNGRRIWLTWREIPQLSDTRQSVGTPRRSADSTPRPIAPKEEIRTEEFNVTSPPIPAIPDPPTTPLPEVAPVPPCPRLAKDAPTVVPVRLDTPQPTEFLLPLQDVLKSLPEASPDKVRQTAWRLGHALNDTGSIGFYIGVLAAVVSGTISVEQVTAAFRAAHEAKGRVRSAGALFTWTLRNWQPVPKFSQINHPQYYRN